MTVYNRYEQAVTSASTALKMAALYKPLWFGLYLLNRAVFSTPPIHPFGFGGPWSESDADLSSAVVISLSASSKTGRAFFWELSRNRHVVDEGPLALLRVQLTSVPHTLPQYANINLPTKSAHYDEANMMAWVGQFQPTRIMIVDFGASDEVVTGSTFIGSL